MCFMCAATATFDPTRHPGEGPETAAVFEGVDAPATTGTPYTISAGDTFSGTIGSGDTMDLVRINLVAGQSYTFELNGFAGGGGTLSDPYLILYNGSGTYVTHNDDGGPGLDSLFTFTATTSGTYYLGIDAYSSTQTGTSTLTTTGSGTPPPPPPPPPPTTPGGVSNLDTLANYLTDGYWNDSSRSGRSFDTSSDTTITVNLTGLTSAGQQLARWALEVWESVVNLNFVETTSFSADITFDDNDTNSAYATSVVSGGTILSSDINVGTGWLNFSDPEIGAYTLQTYIHEIGHALGLGHQGNYNGAATYGIDETYSNDSWQVSVMSYFDQTDNTTTSASFAYVVSLMMADIVAGQNLYGASTATNGNTTWGANTNLGGYWALLFGEMFDGVNSSLVANNNMTFTIFDNGGTDTFDLSTSTSSNRIDMRGNSFSDVNGLTGNVAIARGTVIENLISGSGNDDITGNSADNEIDAGTGNDTVDGGDGTDTAVIGATRASVTVTDLGGGQVRIVSSDGTDTYDNVEFFRFSDGTYSLSDLTGGGGGSGPTTGDDVLTGTASADTINGLGGHDSIVGLAGADSLLGGGGRDTLEGDAGNDTLLGGNGNDRLFGDGDRDRLEGGRGRDRLDGGDERDVLRGGAGLDTLIGGNGSDRLYGGNGDDRVLGGRGSDRIWAGNGQDNVLAGGGRDRIFGQGGNDTLTGGGGNDTLTGGTGDDRLNGGNGVDDFVFADGHGDDTISDFDAFNGGEDIDFSGLSAITSYSDLITNHILSSSGGNVVIDTGGGNSVTLLGVSLANLDATDFIF